MQSDSKVAKLKCLICGKEFINLAAHVLNGHQMSFDRYRKEYNYQGSGFVRQKEWDEKASETRKASTRSIILALRKQLYDRAEGVCERCGKTEEENLQDSGKRLSFHHRNYEKTVPTLEDVELLCAECHSKHHNREGVYERMPKVMRSVVELLKALGVNLTDENFVETPRRVATYLVEHFPEEHILQEALAEFREASFPDAYEGMIIEQGITSFGMCPHHLLPVRYEIALAYLPKGCVAGLSKLTRLARLFASTASLQETVTNRIADAMISVLDTTHVAVLVHGQHQCMTARGVKLHRGIVTTSDMRGHFMTDEGGAKSEFFTMLK